MLDQEADHTFVRAQRRTVDTERCLLLTFGVDKRQIKTLGLGEVNLVGGQRELAADGAPNLHIDLGAVEGCLVGHFHEGNVAVRHGFAHHVFRLGPEAGVVDIFLAQAAWMVRAQPHDKAVDAKEIEVTTIECNDAHELLLELRLGAVDVGVVHLHRAHAHQAEEFTALFVAVARAVLSEAHRQVSIAVQLGRVQLVVERTVHRLDVVADAFHLHGRVHALGVVGQVTAVQEEIFLGQMRRADTVVAGFLFRLFG